MAAGRDISGGDVRSTAQWMERRRRQERGDGNGLKRGSAPTTVNNFFFKLKINTN